MQRKNKKTPRLFFLFLLLFLVVVTAFSAPTDLALHYATAPTLVRTSAAHATDTKETLYCPGGMSFGVRLATKGVLVVGFSRSAQGGNCPAEEAGLCTKDVIEKINGQTVNTVADVIGCIEACEGKKVTLEIDRDGQKRTIMFTPTKDASGVYRAGIWVRDSTAGIGTVTLVDPNNGKFLGLGHGICDSDTGVLMPLLRGNVYDISVVSVRKGKSGAPGELKGYFSPSLCGILLKNTASGVFGRFSEYDPTTFVSPMPLGDRQAVKEGDASLYCTLTSGVITEYSIRISKITSPKGDAKNFVIEVTDPRLLEETGGIVQGMSGSPIIQNGKIVGAVTHVCVNL